MARCAPKCQKTVQALFFINLNVPAATLPNATSSRLQDDLVTGWNFLLFSEKCLPGSGLGRRNQGIVEPIHVQAIEPFGYIPK
ncbi:unnamed protein product (mitochondrion) [Musa hybrid cultivar]